VTEITEQKHVSPEAAAPVTSFSFLTVLLNETITKTDSSFPKLKSTRVQKHYFEQNFWPSLSIT
jgi:hypothetical protein